MKDAYIAGSGLASALGSDLPAAIEALREGGVAPRRFELPSGNAWPYHAIDDDCADWSARAERIVRRVAAESGALSMRDGPLFVASSSVDIGARELDRRFEHDMLAFADGVQHWLDWRGPVYSVCTACTSSMVALFSAADCVRAGLCESALVLGVELRNALSVGGFGAMQLLSQRPARPLGAARDGLVLGEAVAALHVSREPAPWRFAGGANVTDGRDPAGIVPDAVEAACRGALASSGVVPGAIDLVKLQAAGSPSGDANELCALERIFDPLPSLTTLKSALGHTLGASGAAEIALLVACIDAGVWPDAGHPLDRSLGARLVARTPERLRHALVNILGFGGGHTACVLEASPR